MGIVNATTFVFRWQGGGTGFVGVAIYSADGSSRISTTGGIAYSSGSTITTTSGAFTLSAGTTYQVCYCAERTGGGGTNGFLQGVDGSGNSLTNMQQAFTTKISTSAANACVGGSPPLTTGTLTGESHTPLYLQLATDTP